MISGSSSFYFPGTGRPPLSKPTGHKCCLTSNTSICGFPPLDAVPQKTSQALTHTHKFGFCPQQLPASKEHCWKPPWLDSRLGKLFQCSCWAFSTWCSAWTEQTLSMQHLLKSLLQVERASPSVFQKHKALWSCFSTLNHQSSTGMCKNLQTHLPQGQATNDEVSHKTKTFK